LSKIELLEFSEPWFETRQKSHIRQVQKNA